MWYAVAEYADGTRIEKNFPYHENGNYSAECERQYDIECWLLSQHEDCTFYSVVYVEDDCRRKSYVLYHEKLCLHF